MSQRQCLPVDEDESTDSELNFDLSNISAAEYLRKVRSERKKVAEIVTCEKVPANKQINAELENVRNRSIY
jgi:hypothetical protein